MPSTMLYTTLKYVIVVGIIKEEGWEISKTHNIVSNFCKVRINNPLQLRIVIESRVRCCHQRAVHAEGGNYRGESFWLSCRQAKYSIQYTFAPGLISAVTNFLELAKISSLEMRQNWENHANVKKVKKKTQVVGLQENTN